MIIVDVFVLVYLVCDNWYINYNVSMDMLMILWF